jgi:hypothetical protein
MTAADRPLLRHCLATLAYRADKAVRGAPGGFSSFSRSRCCGGWRARR